MVRSKYLIACAGAALALTGCSATDSGGGAKAWTVDTSGWWVPDDSTGCLKETTTCKQEAWTVRGYYAGGAVRAAFTHGDILGLECRAPTPEAIRSSTKVESVFWFYSSYGSEHYWVPDVYVTQDTDAMAEGVPDCTSDTPGIDGPDS